MALLKLHSSTQLLIIVTLYLALWPASATLPFLGGVNTAGYDFSGATNGSFTGTGVDPPPAQYEHFASQGVNVFRIPFGPIDEGFFSRYDATIQAALSSSAEPYVILDLHNYARWEGDIIGQGGPTNEEFASLWSQLTEGYAANPRTIF